jgi:hypothetical protein
MTDTPSAQPENKWKSGLIGGITGAVGATIVGLIFSTNTLSSVGKLFGYSPLPPDAVIFISGRDCGQIGGGWRKFDLADGRFIVGAGANTDFNRNFPPSMTDKGAVAVKLEEKNLPQFKLSIPYWTDGLSVGGLLVGGFAAMTSISKDSQDNAESRQNRYYETLIGGRSEPVDTLPPWIALTACQRSP